jgi:hypothetical protein
MKKISTLVMSLFLVAASVAWGAVPAMNVSVSDSSGKAAFKGTTNSNGAFATAKLKPGNYVLQFVSKSAPKGSHYTIVVSAGKKKVVANAIGAEKLGAGGVAMKIDVGAGLNITGQVAADDKNSAPMGKDGKPMVWIPKLIGSNIAAHWAEADSAEAKQAKTQSSMSTKDIQDKQAQGITPQ